MGVNANKNLAMTSLATNKNPMDSSRQLIDSSTCSVATDGIPADLAYTYRTNYSVQNGNYIRQVSLSGACASSANVWQVATTEALIADANVSVNISYLSVGSSSKNVINIKITAAKKIAGRDIEYTGAMHVRSLNIN